MLVLGDLQIRCGKKAMSQPCTPDGSSRITYCFAAQGPALAPGPCGMQSTQFSKPKRRSIEQLLPISTAKWLFRRDPASSHLSTANQGPNVYINLLDFACNVQLRPRGAMDSTPAKDEDCAAHLL